MYVYDTLGRHFERAKHFRDTQVENFFIVFHHSVSVLVSFTFALFMFVEFVFEWCVCVCEVDCADVDIVIKWKQRRCK